MGSGWDVRPHQLTSPFPPAPAGSCTIPHSPHFPALAISPLSMEVILEGMVGRGAGGNSLHNGA